VLGIQKSKSLNLRPLKRPFLIKMVFPAALAVKELIGPQFKHTLFADKKFFAAGKHL